MADSSRILNPPDIQKKVQDLETILEVSRAMTAEKDLDRLLGLITTASTRILQADRSSLFIHDDKKNELWTRIAQGLNVKEIRVPVGRGIVGFVAESKQVVNIPDAYADPRFNQEVDKKTGYHTRTILCVPLLTYENKVMGVIQVLNKAEGTFDSYDESLLMALGSHAAIALDNDRLVEHFLDKQKLKQALEIAREIQLALLPKAAPESTAFDITGLSIAADETGGDFFDYLELPGGRIGIVIADVVGHGIGAALLMATARAFLRALGLMDQDPAKVLFSLNNLLARDLDAGRFVTLLYGILDPEARTLVYSSAGHDAPLHYRAATDDFLELDSTGLPLGIMADMDFPTAEPVKFGPGDSIVFTTDGVWEAPNAEGDAFGRDRMKDAIRGARTGDAHGISGAVHDALMGFLGEMKPKDDVTMVVVKPK